MTTGSPDNALRLANKSIVVGISGGIAAYKCAELVRLLGKQGADVRVVMTQAAQAFIAPMTFQALTGNPVHTHLLDPEAEAAMGHIELARWADLLLIAPASADLLARLCHGHADDLLTTIHLASSAPLLLAPAMNQAMWRHPATQANVQQLSQWGCHWIGPAAGEQACGDVGPGRMEEPQQICDAALRLLAPRQCLQGCELTITAGPTREALDPVRYISNHSSGKMGFALAQAAQQAGARVNLIAGPVELATPAGVNRIDVNSALEMYDAAHQWAPDSDIFIACAAVADYRPETCAEQKIKKTDSDELLIRMVKNPDIVASIATLPQRPFTVGFAAETQDVEHYGRSKLERKKLDMVIANDVSNRDIGFNADQNAVTVITTETEQSLPTVAKSALGRQLIDLIAERYHTKDGE